MNKIRILIISGTLETSLHPVPPVADGAPEWNIFRLAEAAAANPESRLDIHVVSPCEAAQVERLQDYPVLAKGKYHHIVIDPVFVNVYRRWLRHLLPLRLLVRRLAKLPDLMSWWYLKQVKSVLREISPQMVFINGRPQYVRYLKPLVAPGRLWFFMRSEMGESRRHLGLLDGIVVNSDGMEAYVRKFIAPDGPPVYKMPNMLGDEFVIPAAPKDRFERHQKTILFTGRLIPDKGVMELLNAFELVLRHIPNARLVICGASINSPEGDGDTPYELALQKKAASLPGGSVHFAGYVPNRDLGKYYVSANLAVFPSICKESFGMVALEAMRCGTPVVASRQPGFEELVLPDKTGLLVDDSRDADILAQTILQIIQDPPTAQGMGRAGYERSFNYTPVKALHAFGETVLNYLGGQVY